MACHTHTVYIFNTESLGLVERSGGGDCCTCLAAITRRGGRGSHKLHTAVIEVRIVNGDRNGEAIRPVAK